MVRRARAGGPDFVDGVVNVAQRGRSLGLHLVLATQRPAGVIKDNLRANTNLRLALRMADEADSADVLGSPEAAHIDPALPGRAVSKTGPGRLVPFQAAYVGGWTTSGHRRPDVSIEELVIGTGLPWHAPEPVAAAMDAGHGPTDIVRITDNIRRARTHSPAATAPAAMAGRARGRLRPQQAAHPSPRRRAVFGVVDEPEYQRQTTAVFYPDRDGNLAIYGTGGAGKSTALRSFAIAAALTARGGPCQVYGLDFSSRGWRCSPSCLRGEHYPRRRARPATAAAVHPDGRRRRPGPALRCRQSRDHRRSRASRASRMSAHPAPVDGLSAFRQQSRRSTEANG